MEYAMNRPWWVGMTDDAGRDEAHGHRRGKRRDRRERRADDGPGSPGGRFGGHHDSGIPFPGFGHGGIGPMGPGGPMDPGHPGHHGPGGRRGRGLGGRARRGDVRQAILALLAEQPMNGYQIITTLADRTQGLWKPSPGAVYPALAQLTDEGLIAETQAEGQRAFELTDAGRGAAASAERPWETVNAEARAAQDGIDDRAWIAHRGLGTAVQAVTWSGTPDQIAAAASVIGDAEKAIYRLLAGSDE